MARAGHCANIGLAPGRAVKRDVADEDVILRDKGGTRRWIDDDLAPGQPFSDVVVAVAFENQRHAGRDKGAETLSGRALKVQLDRVLRQSFWTITTREVAADHRPNDAVHVPDRHLGADLLASLPRWPAAVESRAAI